MTLRAMLGSDVQRFQNQIDELRAGSRGPLYRPLRRKSTGELRPGIRSVTVSARVADRRNLAERDTYRKAA